MSTSFRHSQAAGLKAQRGFTLISTAVSTLVAGSVLAGVWIGFMALKTHWRVSNVERMMDQYAASAMQELTNTITWCWGAKQVQGGPRDPRWKFYIDDIIAEESMSVSRWDRDFHIGPDRMLELSYRPTAGILFNGIAPLWAADRLHRFYVWTGQPGVPRFLLRTMDRRDRMTVESLLIEFNRFDYLPMSGNVNERLKRSQTVWIELTMHYSYNASNWFGLGTQPYGSSYVRERKYTTQIAMRNWDVEHNWFRDEVLGLSGNSGS